MIKFLTIKRFPLFVLLIGLPVDVQFVILGFVTASKNPSVVAVFIPLIIILFLGLFSGWLYTLATHLHRKLPPTAKMNLGRFKLFLSIPLLYVILLWIFILGMFSDMSTTGQPDAIIVAIAIPLNVFVIFCLFYCLHFTAKALKTVEGERPVTSFGDFSQEFFLLWLFPVGLWVIQPRINQLFDPRVDKSNF